MVLMQQIGTSAFEVAVESPKAYRAFSRQVFFQRILQCFRLVIFRDVIVLQDVNDLCSSGVREIRSVTVYPKGARPQKLRMAECDFLKLRRTRSGPLTCLLWA